MERLFRLSGKDDRFFFWWVFWRGYHPEDFGAAGYPKAGSPIDHRAEERRLCAIAPVPETGFRMSVSEPAHRLLPRQALVPPLPAGERGRAPPGPPGPGR